MVTLIAPRKTAATATTSGTLTRGSHTPVDATAAALTMTLPTNAPVGVEVSVEKVDASTNAVTISGTIRGASSTLSLTSQYDARTFLSEGNGSWRPISDHRTQTSLDTRYARAMGWVIATDPAYGAVGDWTGGTSGTDNTAALQAALNAASATGTVCFIPAAPAGKGYKFSTLTLGKSTSLRGAGYASLLQWNFGGSAWTDSANRSQTSGTVLYSTATTGNAIKGDDPIAARWQLSDFMVIGPGSGTSTGISLAETGSFNIRPNISNVLVANFSRGWKIGTTNEAQLDSMVAYGCSTGFDFGPFFNANKVTNLEAQYTTVEAIRLSGIANHFDVTIAQNVAGTSGLHVLVNSPNNTFTQFYTENNTATDAVLLESGVRLNGHLASNGGNIRSTVGNCLYEDVYAPGATLFLGTGTQRNTIIRCGFAAVSAPGQAEVIDIGTFSRWPKSNAIEIGPPGATGAWQFLLSGANLDLRDLVNSHPALNVFPGATDATTYFNFHGIIGNPYSNTVGRPNAGNYFNGAQWYDTDQFRPVWTDGTAYRDALGYKFGILTKTTSYTVVNGDRVVIANGASVTITLPDPTTVSVGIRPVTVKNINAAACSVVSAGTSKTIDGAASQSLAQWARMEFVSDGTQWLIV